MPKKDVLRETDADAIAQAKHLMRSAASAALAVLDPDTGAPLASRVATACDVSGAPIILISQLSAHFGALEADPRCSLLFGEPGKGDPLAHPRITVTAQAERLEGEARTTARERFLRYQPKAALYADFGDFAFWRLSPTGASLNGGFGKAYALTATDLASPVPEGFTALDPDATAHMNADHADTYPLLIGQDARLLGIDAEGMDFGAGETRLRHSFSPPLRACEELRPRLVALVKRARANSP